MLAVDHYDQTYVDGCRERVGTQVAAYQELIAAARDARDPREERLGAAIDTFEPLFFNNMVLVLDDSFLHRSRNLEGKDGNPLNEVRMLAGSILKTGRVLAADKTIKYKAETSVLGLAIGDEIVLDEAQFVRLSKAFFAEIEQRFT